MDIRQKGIQDDLLAAAVEVSDIDWLALARDVAERKFGNRPAKEQKDKAKRMRFLQYRGFNFDQIKYALSGTEIDEY
jgi:regulatory protein